jgi:hypothetical protein
MQIVPNFVSQKAARFVSHLPYFQNGAPSEFSFSMPSNASCAASVSEPLESFLLKCETCWAISHSRLEWMFFMIRVQAAKV